MIVRFNKGKGWSLRDKFKAVLSGAVLVALVFSGLGIWRYALFNRNQQLIQQSSRQHQDKLADNFDTTQVLGEIQADLVSFIQTASQADLEKIQGKAQHIMAELPVEKKPILTGLLTKIRDLENLLGVYRTNNAKALESGNTILAEIEKSGACGGNKLCREALLAIGQAYRNSHPHYFDVILSGNNMDLAQARVEINAAMEGLDNHLFLISRNLPENQAAYLRRITNLVYDLDEAMTTVVAVKQKLLDSETEIQQDLRAIEESLAADSVEKSREAAALMDHGLELASDYAGLVFLAMLALILLFLVLGWALSRNMIAPLVSLVDMLKRFSQLITAVGRHSEEKDNYEKLSSLMLDRADEIGDVMRATKELMDRMQGISSFRQKIEADSSVGEIFHRLGRVFSTQLGLTIFAFHEINAEGALVPAYTSPPELKEGLPEFNLANDCRCKRTATIVYSLPDPEICRVCQLDNVVNYCCVPMLVGGSVLGVLQFILPFSMYDSAEKEVSESLAVAQSYLAEALPVIEAKRSASRLQDMATTDQLTGLYNRHYLEICLDPITAGIKRRGSNLGVLLCDVDFFKQINDTYGHDAGDLVLTELAAILLKCVRSSDLVFRFGGEEFLILLLDVHSAMVDKVAEKIRATVQSTLFSCNGSELSKTISIGISEFPEMQAKGVWETIKQADVALYHAKAAGRNRVVRFEPEMWVYPRY